jgi:hypothetical protein
MIQAPLSRIPTQALSSITLLAMFKPWTTQAIAKYFGIIPWATIAST